MTRVSVAMCTYNGKRYLSEQLESIAQQTRLPDELVICDDGSTDGTIELLKAFAEKALFKVRLLHNEGETLGVTKNFERALSASDADIIVLCDQDDVWSVSRLKRIEAALSDAPLVGYCFSDAVVIDENGRSLSGTLWERAGLDETRLQLFNAGQQTHALLNGSNFTYGMTMAIRGEALSFILPIKSRSKNCTHDVWISIILSAIGYKGLAIKESLAFYRQHNQQVAGAANLKMNWWRAAARSLRSTRNHDGELPDDLDEMAIRVNSFPPVSLDAAMNMRLIQSKARHLRIRKEASGQTLPIRFVLIIAELLTGRYSLFSSSWRTALRDIIG